MLCADGLRPNLPVTPNHSADADVVYGREIEIDMLVSYLNVNNDANTDPYTGWTNDVNCNDRICSKDALGNVRAHWNANHQVC